MWQLLVVLLAAALGIVVARHLMLKRELNRLAACIEEIQIAESNRQLTVECHQPELVQLVVAINRLYDDIAAEKVDHRTAMDEIRGTMSNISHDLRTPLTSIIGYLKLLRGSQLSPEAQAHLEVAYRKAEDLNRLVTGLFEVARLENQGYTFEHQRLDVAAALGEELAAIYTQMQARGLHLSVQLPQEPLWVIGDKTAFSRMFANLLQNMAKHGQPPMEVSATAQNKMAVLRFSNHAPGLTQEDTRQLFSRFFTADRMRSGQNTGLGLTIVKAFAEQMQGTVTAQLQNDTLTIELFLPLATTV